MNEIKVGDIFQYKSGKKYVIKGIYYKCPMFEHDSCLEFQMNLIEYTTIAVTDISYRYCTHSLNKDLIRKNCWYVSKRIKLK